MNPITLEDLQKFCTCDKIRYELTQPFTAGEFTYATDGRIAVRVPAIPGADATPKKTDLTKAFAHDATLRKPIELPRGWQDFPELKGPCNSCKGTGKYPEMIECDTCDGSGEVTCSECDNDHDCKDCNGKGEVRGNVNAVCENCHGACEVPHTTPISANRGELYFNDSFLRRIFTLPDVAMSYHPDLPNEPAAFTFTGGEGRIMGMRASEAQIETAKTQWP